MPPKSLPNPLYLISVIPPTTVTQTRHLTITFTLTLPSQSLWGLPLNHLFPVTWYNNDLLLKSGFSH